ncbi:hypothetical protein [Haloplanus salilacus]|uniref:hypothetical protein n=1 Tax=Haloplanus salilacus TaxID=2949994 RepID=UPI0030CCBFCD
MDRYGAGLELRPWESISERAVYDHVKGRWRAPKRWIRYDGAPGDVAVVVIVGVALLVVLSRPVRWIVAVTLTVGCVYGLLRRRLATFAPEVVGRMPDRVEARAPERYRR